MNPKTVSGWNSMERFSGSREARGSGYGVAAAEDGRAPGAFGLRRRSVLRRVLATPRLMGRTTELDLSRDAAIVRKPKTVYDNQEDSQL
jgi:hypothetical protein